MSYIEHPKAENIEEFIKKYNDSKANNKHFKISSTDSWVRGKAEAPKKCCDTCESFEADQLQKNTGWCLELVTNDIYSEYIENADTFYCSKHKFKGIIN